MEIKLILVVGEGLFPGLALRVRYDFNLLIFVGVHLCELKGKTVRGTAEFTLVADITLL
jgi:hypothetical protein